MEIIMNLIGFTLAFYMFAEIKAKGWKRFWYEDEED